MSDRWDEEDEAFERGRSRRERDREPEPEPTVGELIEGSVRKLVTGIVIAGALIGLGIYSSRGGDSAPDYQITTSPDGRIVYRLETDRGRIIACQPNGTHCWQVVSRGQRLDDDAPAETNNAAPPTPVQAQPAPAQLAPAQPAPAQLPAPQNTAAPAAR